MSELTYIRPGSEFLGATEGRHPETGALIVELAFAHPTHPQTIQVDFYVWHTSQIRVQPRGWLEEPEATVIDGSPGDLFDEPSPVSVPPRAGERVAWRMARGESAVNQAGYDPTDAESAGGGLS